MQTLFFFNSWSYPKMHIFASAGIPVSNISDIWAINNHIKRYKTLYAFRKSPYGLEFQFLEIRTVVGRRRLCGRGKLNKRLSKVGDVRNGCWSLRCRATIAGKPCHRKRSAWNNCILEIKISRTHDLVLVTSPGQSVLLASLCSNIFLEDMRQPKYSRTNPTHSERWKSAPVSNLEPLTKKTCLEYLIIF